jgi:sulfate adenylyltransferase
MSTSTDKNGMVLFFTGLSGSGKSTLASALTDYFEAGGVKVTLLDGDVIRTHLSSELGFIRAHRSINVRRASYVASEIARHGGICICAMIAPYEEDRIEARGMVEQKGGRFVEIAVSTPIEVCESRDPKQLYVRARAGEILEFTGVSDPYEFPSNPEITIDTSTISVDEGLGKILAYLASVIDDRGLKKLLIAASFSTK